MISGYELARARPGLFGFWLDEVVRPVDEARDRGAVACDAVEAGLDDGVLDFFDFRVVFFELAPGAERVEPELRVVLGFDGDAFAELEVDDSNLVLRQYHDISSTKSVRSPVRIIHTLFK